MKVIESKLKRQKLLVVIYTLITNFILVYCLLKIEDSILKWVLICIIGLQLLWISIRFLNNQNSIFTFLLDFLFSVSVYNPKMIENVEGDKSRIKVFDLLNLFKRNTVSNKIYIDIIGDTEIFWIKLKKLNIKLKKRTIYLSLITVLFFIIVSAMFLFIHFYEMRSMYVIVSSLFFRHMLIYVYSLVYDYNRLSKSIKSMNLLGLSFYTKRFKFGSQSALKLDADHKGLYEIVQYTELNTKVLSTTN